MGKDAVVGGVCVAVYPRLDGVGARHSDGGDERGRDVAAPAFELERAIAVWGDAARAERHAARNRAIVPADGLDGGGTDRVPESPVGDCAVGAYAVGVGARCAQLVVRLNL